MRIVKVVSILLLAPALCVAVQTAFAADQTAASCSASDIQIAVDSSIAGGGGTITIPACDVDGCTNGSCWSNGDQVNTTTTTTIRILGSGSTLTRIGWNDDQTEDEPMFFLCNTGIVEFGNMYLEGNFTAETYRIDTAMKLYGMENALIHDIETAGFRGPTALICGGSNIVVYNSTFRIIHGNSYHFYVFGPCDQNPLDWSSNWGTNNYQVFFEDNVFEECHHPISFFTGGTGVIRYNTFNFDQTDSSVYTNVIDAHNTGFGNCPGDSEPCNWDCTTDRGGRAYEIYSNDFNWNGTTDMKYFARIRSGQLIWTANNTTATTPPGYVRQAVQLVCERNGDGELCTSENNYPVDVDYTDSCSTGDGCCDKVRGSYIWNNTLTNTTEELTTGSSCGEGALVENSDYFMRAPTQIDDGFTWTAYTYPHPLRTAADTTSPAAPTGLKVN